jgi:7-keto-8-aminopelargonate synthetase-like enzyme
LTLEQKLKKLLLEIRQKNIFRYDALVFIDECHATGFFGKTGRGTEEFFEMVKMC